MARIKLRHLTFLGTGIDPVGVEFGPRTTLVRGPSDTGKSFIVDAIDFMFGSTSLKEIPERQGYSTVLLGLTLPDGSDVTLSRSVNGGSIGLFRTDVRSGPLAVPDESLSPTHSATSETNLSRYMLRQTGLDARRIRKNARNETDSLSFRNVVHLCIVDETQMQSEVSPPLSGSYVTKTKEISVLKLLLQDEDDSSLVAVTSKTDRTRVSSAKLDVVERLIEDVQAQLSDISDEGEIRDQLARLNGSINDRTASIEQLAALREDLARDLLHAQRSGSAALQRSDEADALRARFDLLLRQYESDLARLEMIAEAGTLLGYFTAGVCVFCGADPEHQQLNDLCEGEATYVGESVAAEQLKTSQLRDDLIATLTDLDAQRRSLGNEIAENRSRTAELRERLVVADQSLRPSRGDLQELLASRTAVEKTLGLYEQLAKLQNMKTRIENEAEGDTASAVAGIDLGALREFSAEMARRLQAWQVPDAQSVRYDRSEQDIIAGDQLRSAHGKGVRAVLHAAFTIALAQYCFDRDIPHPGFVVLDSPLVTYRPPDLAEDDHRPSDDEDENLTPGVVAAFYTDIQMNFDGQIIVMENTDPPNALEPQSANIQFTKLASLGRYGFFPGSANEPSME